MRPLTGGKSPGQPMMAAVGLIILLLLAGCGGGDKPDVPFSPLLFPVSHPEDLVGLAAFGIPDWSGTESHNGIDLIVDDSLASTEIVSPTAGFVSRVESATNPYSRPPGQLLLTVSLRVNAAWQVELHPGSPPGLPGGGPGGRVLGGGAQQRRRGARGQRHGKPRGRRCGSRARARARGLAQAHPAPARGGVSPEANAALRPEPAVDRGRIFS